MGIFTTHLQTLPHFNLDNSVINTKNLSFNDEKNDSLHTVAEDEVVIKKNYQENYSKRIKASSCREILNQIKSLTYWINDIDTSDDLEYQLQASLEELLENEATQEERVKFQPVKVMRKIKESNIKDKIPKVKRMKSNLTSRIRVKAEQT